MTLFQDVSDANVPFRAAITDPAISVSEIQYELTILNFDFY